MLIKRIRTMVALVMLGVVLLPLTAAPTFTAAAPEATGGPARLLGAAELSAAQLRANAAAPASPLAVAVEPDLEGNDAPSPAAAGNHPRQSLPPLAPEGGGQPAAPAAQSPLPVTSWNTQAGEGGFAGDPTIAASNTYVVVTNRADLSFYNKAGQVLYGPTSVYQFFQPLSSVITSTTGFFDARVIYDAYRDRFWVVAMHGSSLGSVCKYNFIAVSKTQNPLDGWYQYYYDCVATADASFKSSYYGDYPTLGINACCIFQSNIVVDMQPSRTNKYSRVIFFDAAQMAAGSSFGSVSGWQYWDIPYPGTSSRVLDLIQMVVHHTDPGRAYLITQPSTDASKMIVWAIQAPLQPSQSLSAQTVSVATFNGAGTAPQLGTSRQIKMDNLLNWPIKAVYRNGKLYAVMNDRFDWFSDAQLLSSIRLLRLDVSSFPTVGVDIDRTFGKNSSSDDNPADHMYYGWPAIEVNSSADMAIVYARSGAPIDPEVRYSAYYHADADISPSRQLKAGEAPYAQTNPQQFWGDTSGASLDPYDDTAIWLAQQYATSEASSNNYDIWVSKVFGAPHPELSVSALSHCCPVVVAGETLTVSWTIWNQGDGSATPDVGVYLSTNSIISTFDTRIDLRSRSLASGEAKAATLALTVPPGLAPGVYYVGAIVDPGNAIAEYDESNNGALSTFNGGKVLVLGPKLYLPLIER